MYIPGGWQMTVEAAQMRWSRRAARLLDGRVLLISANDARAELLAPGNTKWTFAGEMSSPRCYGSLVVLPDGRALAIAGRIDEKKDVLATCELFDPANASWRPAPPLPAPRWAHAAILVGERVLVCGGKDAKGSALSSVLAWTPGDDVWTTLPPLNHAHSAPKMVLLGDGSVLLTGTACERWDPSTDAWSLVANAPAGRTDSALVALPDGAAALLGGIEAKTETARVDRFSPAAGWSRGTDLPESLDRFGAVALPDGRIAIAGGYGTRSTREDSSTGGELDIEYRSFSGTWVDKRVAETGAVVGTIDGVWKQQFGVELYDTELVLLDDTRVLTIALHCLIWTP